MIVKILDDWDQMYVDHPAIEKLKRHFDVEIFHDQPSKLELIERLKNVDVVIPIRERTSFSEDVLQSMQQLKLIAQTGTGVAHIDMDEVNRLAISVANTPGGTGPIVELIFGFILAFSRQLIPLHEEMKQGVWTQTVGLGLENKTIGIIGLGQIGQGVAKIAKAFNMKVLSWGPRLTKERAEQHGVEYASLECLLKESDFVTLNVRLVPETTNLLTSQHFKMMKQGAFFINTSRGKLVDEAALIHALREKQIGGAGLDVFSQEPLMEGHPLLELDNVILSPHIGWKTDTMYSYFLSSAVENIISYFIDKKPINIINPNVAP